MIVVASTFSNNSAVSRQFVERHDETTSTVNRMNTVHHLTDSSINDTMTTTVLNNNNTYTPFLFN